MKKYAILMALAAMLCGSEARAATIGFEPDFLVPSFPPNIVGTEAGFNISGNGGSPNNWIITAYDENHYASSVHNGSGIGAHEFMIELADHAQFTVQSLDLLSLGGTSTFHIAGIPDFDSAENVLFEFNVTVLADNTFTRILVAEAMLGNYDGNENTYRPSFNDSNGLRTLFDVNSDQVQRLVISATRDPGITSGVDCIHANGDPNANPCSSGLGAGAETVPEPASLLLLGAGLAGIGIWRRKVAKIG